MRFNADKLEPGWLYVYRNGYLWRELEVHARGRMRDVNLTEHQGKDARPSTGESDNRVLLPYKIGGETPEIQVCYSQVQWSWARINALGGMDPDDPRLNDQTAMPNAEQKSKSAQLRRQRMGPPFDLSGYKRNFNDDNMPFSPAENGKCMVARLHHKKGVPLLYLHDPMTLVADSALRYLEKLSELKALVAESQKHEHYQSAILAYHALFNPENTREPIVTDYGMVSGYKDIDYLTDARDELDRAYIEEILKVKARRKVRKELRALKEEHVHLLRGNMKTRDGKYKPIRDVIPDADWFVDFATAIVDGFACDPKNYVKGFAAFAGGTSFIYTDCSLFDQGMDLPEADKEKPDPDKDPGFLYLREIMEPGHPLHDKLFPKPETVDPYKEEQQEYKLEDEYNNGDGVFRSAAFAHMYNTDAEVVFFSQGTRRVIQTGKQIVLDLLAVWKNQWEHAMADQRTTIMERTVGLAKAANDPLLNGMTLVPKGETLKDRIIIDGKARVERSIRTTMRDARSGETTVQRTNKVEIYELLHDFKADEYVADPNAPRFKPVKVKEIGPKNIYQFSGYITPVTDRRWSNILFSASSDGEYRIRETYVTIPKVSKIVEYFHNPNAHVSDTTMTVGKVIDKAKYALPPLVVFFEVWNLQQAVVGLSGRKNTVRKGFELVDAVLGLSHSMVEATEILLGREKAGKLVTRFLSTVTTRARAKAAANFLFKKEMQTFLGPARILNVLGAGFAGLSAVLSAWDMIYSLRRGDAGAAIGYGIMTVGFAGLAVSMLRSPAGALRFFGPLGWAAMLVITIGVMVVQWFKDTDLEKWAKFGPLGKERKGRPVEEYEGWNGKDCYAALAALLQRPQIKFMKKPGVTYLDEGGVTGRYLSDIVAVVSLPVFEVGKSSVDVRVARRRDRIGPDAVTNWVDGWFDKEEVEPYKVVQLRDTESGAIREVHCYFKPQDSMTRNKIDFHWYAKVRVFTSDQMRIPPVPPGTPRDELQEDGRIDNKAEGWLYAEVFDA